MTKTVHVSEIKRDITAMPDEELMAKYGLSQSDLTEFFDRVMKACAYGQELIDLESEGQNGSLSS